MHSGLAAIFNARWVFCLKKAIGFLIFKGFSDLVLNEDRTQNYDQGEISYTLYRSHNLIVFYKL